MALKSIGDLELRSGKILKDVKIAYHTYGKLNPSADNALIICHALTGDHYPGRFGKIKGWWDSLIGPGKVIDPGRYFIVCSNVLGGCYGTTGPSSIDPDTQAPYAMNFPVVEFADTVRGQVRLARQLGIKKIHAVLGGSMGGLQVLEWGMQEEIPVQKLIVMAASPKSSPFVIAFHEIQRQAIMLDPDWRGGEYYGREIPSAGLSVARMVANLSYRSEPSLTAKFGRKPAWRTGVAEDPYQSFEQRFDVQSYMNYQGDALVHRFDPNSYLYLTKAVDLFDISRGRKDLEEAMASLQGDLYCLSINTDLLFPPHEIVEMVRLRRKAGKPAEYYEMNSIHGHDAFLIEFPIIEPVVKEWLD
ncbi:MAG: homoserine O-acetyltransferase [Peptococcaceae bacterium]|nr:homoserine O-acetyltransferase [Peptococcaceae bacterium]